VNHEPVSAVIAWLKGSPVNNLVSGRVASLFDESVTLPAIAVTNARGFPVSTAGGMDTVYDWQVTIYALAGKTGRGNDYPDFQAAAFRFPVGRRALCLLLQSGDYLVALLACQQFAGTFPGDFLESGPVLLVCKRKACFQRVNAFHLVPGDNNLFYCAFVRDGGIQFLDRWHNNRVPVR